MPECTPVVLVVAPVIDLVYPPLGPGILAGACHDRGIAARTVYANVNYALRVGYDLSQRIAFARMHYLLAESIFRPAAYGDPEATENDALDALFARHGAVPVRGFERDRVTRDEALSALRAVPAFVRDAADEILSYQPRVVGFSSMFQQNLASVAIARRIKSLRPDVVTVFGGANATEPMGPALAETTDALDYVFSGEADFAFADFCERYLRDGALPAQRLVHCGIVADADMDRIAVPDYEDFAAVVAPHAARGELPELPKWLFFESSRGCWYGQKNHCTFCGLNALGMPFRKKSPARVLRELEDTAARYRVKTFFATDNIMPVDFGRTVLPSLARRPEPLELFYEVKANLREEDLDQLALAGVVEVQPGIEALSSNVLKQMAKGVSALQNLKLLRDCMSRNIGVVWNVITGVPGEAAADYEDVLALLPKLEHLQPPGMWESVTVDRYSPYHAHPGHYGFARLTPTPMYRHVYPEGSRIDDIAYQFDAEYQTPFTADARLRERFDRAMEAWAARWDDAARAPRLTFTPLGPGRAIVYDSRACAVVGVRVVEGELLEALELCRRPLRRERVPVERAAAVDELVRLGWVVAHEGQLLSLVTEPHVGARLREESARLRREGEAEGEAEGPGATTPARARVALPLVSG